jgi:hypothetical protein
MSAKVRAASGVIEFDALFIWNITKPKDDSGKSRHKDLIARAPNPTLKATGRCVHENQ